MAIILIPIVLFLIALPQIQSNKKQAKVQPGSPISIYVNNVSPQDNPTETYKYYTLPFCKPENTFQTNQSFGENLSGDRKMDSIYQIEFKQNINRLAICNPTLNKKQIKKFKQAIYNNFIAEFYVQDFSNHIATHDAVGIYLNQQSQFLLKNHIEFNIYLNPSDKFLHANITKPDANDYKDYVLLNDDKQQQIDFFYSVKYITVKESSDVYEYDQLDNPEQDNIDQNSQIHWISIINSFILVTMLVILVSIVLKKTIRNDVIQSKNLEVDTDEIGWKRIRTEALLPPETQLLLSTFIGSGIQFLYLTALLVVFGVLGFYYGHHDKGFQKTIGIFLFVFTGISNGYYSSKYYKFMGGKHWALTLISACIFFPLLFFFIWSVLNSIAWYNDSTAAIPFSSVLLIFCLWLLLYVPLTVIGGITGRMRNTDDLLNPDMSLPRLYKSMPPKKVYQQSFTQFILAGLLPFSSIMLELYYVVDSIWGHHVYHLYSILFLALVLLILVHICVSITMTYLQLNSQDYNWWWRSFINGGSVSFFFFLYSVYFYFYKTKMHGIIQGSFYFGYTSLFCVAMFVMFGSISFLVSKKFVLYIYSQSKLD